MELIITGDGSHTIFVPSINEQYHSVNGAATESEYVYVEKGFRFCKTETPSVFEVGFGTGLNCLLTLAEAIRTRRYTKYTSVEKFPLDIELIENLNYGTLFQGASELFRKIHGAHWNTEVKIGDFFTLLKLETDLTDFKLLQEEKHNVIYFDAFGPDKQPEMWSPAVFNTIFSLTADSGVFVTYSAKGEVRRQLSACGFAMERLPGPPGKNQMLRGIKPPSNV